MIKLESVDKYFNRHKKNEIHVINNTTLEFNNTGLVAILGPSGCGKTTLLNSIGGLDKVNSGNIYIDGVKITKRSSSKVDEIRTLNIGYIFQDYKLIDNMTVFDNVALSLKLIGIKDKSEIDKRVIYALEKVNMARYKNRPASMLSGGERQRVGIARALVKNPKIIIADEPTGNLDSKNSLEIMNIIKSISEKYLVILVTHEEELARFYATRIIELKDGLVEKDYENKNNNNLNYEIENRIYLKDYEDIKNIKKDNININVYRDNNEKLDLNIVFKNGSIYIESINDNKIEVVENNSNIELINDHYKEIKNAQDLDKDFDIASISNTNIKEKYSSIFHLGSFISYGFKKVLDYPFFKKVLLGGFILSGMFIFYALASIFAVTNIKDEDFVTMNREYLTVTKSDITVEDYLKYESNNDIEYILPSDSIINFNIYFDKYLQTQFISRTFSASLSDITKIKKEDLVMGKMPSNNYELVIDEMVLDNFMKSADLKEAGFTNLNDFLNHDIYLQNMSAFKIVGITHQNEPNVYANKDMFINMLANTVSDNVEYYYEDAKIENNLLLDYSLVIDEKVKLVKGNLPKNDYEIVINKSLEDTYNINSNIKFNNHNYKVVGYYENIDDNDMYYYLVNNNTVKYNLINQTNKLSIYSHNKDNTLKLFRDAKINIQDSYLYAKEQYLESRHDTNVGILTISGIILGISLIEILLMIRSSFLSRIKEVGIYRAIGIKKLDIYKMFSGEIIAITIMASIPGITFMAYILYCFRNVPYIGNMYVVNIPIYLFSLIVVLIFNVIVGLIPVYNTIRKTPAQILARFDVD